ncbi:MAG: CRISPR-associated endonuclease Cas2 [Spirochaetales bacterium]|nr:CRISPR-associated endonuclease Cas2 [Spirochaetales bacterium]
MNWWKHICNGIDDNEEIQPTTKQLYLVVYDIVDNKRRYRVHKCLKSYGSRIQRSAFECMLTETQYKEVIKKLTRLIDKRADLLRAYRVPTNGLIQSWGNNVRLDDDEAFWIV